MKVNIILHVSDREGTKSDLIFEADLKSDRLCATDGLLNVYAITGMEIDCMPEIRKE